MSNATQDARPTLSEVVAENIRAEAGRRNWSQSALARALGVTSTTINRRWLGASPWPLDDIERVSVLMGIDPLKLLARSEGFEPPTFWSGVSPAEPTAVTAQRIAPVVAMSDYRQAVAS